MDEAFSFIGWLFLIGIGMLIMFAIERALQISVGF